MYLLYLKSEFSILFVTTVYLVVQCKKENDDYQNPEYKWWIGGDLLL